MLQIVYAMLLSPEECEAHQQLLCIIEEIARPWPDEDVQGDVEASAHCLDEPCISGYCGNAFGILNSPHGVNGRRILMPSMWVGWQAVYLSSE